MALYAIPRNWPMPRSIHNIYCKYKPRKFGDLEYFRRILLLPHINYRPSYYVVQLLTDDDWFHFQQASLCIVVSYGPWLDHVCDFWDHRQDKNVLFLIFEDMLQVAISLIFLRFLLDTIGQAPLI